MLKPAQFREYQIRIYDKSEDRQDDAATEQIVT